MRKLDDLSSHEEMIVHCICALVDMLENDIDYYLPAIASSRQYFGKKPGRSRGEKDKGFLQKHEPRVTRRWE